MSSAPRGRLKKGYPEELRGDVTVLNHMRDVRAAMMTGAQEWTGLDDDVYGPAVGTLHGLESPTLDEVQAAMP